MKKIKKLLIIPALVAILPATLALTQCNKNTGDRTPTVDPSVSDKVSISIVKNDDGSATCTLTPKSASKEIDSVTVKIGETTLVEGTDYDTNINKSNSLVITIYKSAMDKYSGNIVITPVLSDREMDGIWVNLNKTSFELESKFTKDCVSINARYDNEIGESISPTDPNVTVTYDGTDKTSDFKGSGIDVGSEGDHVLIIKYKSFSGGSKTINVTKKQITIQCTLNSEAKCVTLSKTSFKGYENDTWLHVQNDLPKAVGKTDVDANNISTKWVYQGTDNEIPNSEYITSNLKPEMKISLPDASSTQTMDFVKSSTRFSGGKGYVPEACMPSTSLQYTTLKSGIEYSFTITVPADETIRWFWFYNGSSSRIGELVYIYENSIISITDQNNADIEYTIVPYGSSNGNYIQFKDDVGAGTTITIKFRMLKDFNNCIIPVYQHKDQQ